MTVISHIDFEILTDDGWKAVPAGTYRLDTAVRPIGGDESSWMPGKTVVIPAAGSPAEVVNFFHPFYLCCALVICCSFWGGFKFRI